MILFYFQFLIFSSKSIIDLTDSNFNCYAANKPFMLVDMYVPWCSDCKQIAPQIEYASAQLGPNSCLIGRADCMNAAKNLCDSLGIHSWPHLMIFNNGRFSGEYTGPQDSISVLTYVNSQMSQVRTSFPVCTATQQCMRSDVPAEETRFDGNYFENINTFEGDKDYFMGEKIDR
ncbi:hypothetical protein HZS_6089 [Henneguya salminicola]|nr:hypothetical protein HZS_6089 [Henneguya salminicola]